MAGIASLLVLSCVMGITDDGVMLREQAGDGTTRVLIEMKADGEIRPAEEPAATKGAAKLKPQPLKVEGRLDFFERSVKRDPDGMPRKSARRVVEAVAAIGSARGLSKLRPEVALLIADRRDPATVVFSPSGPLTRTELDLIQVPGEPLALGGLLPDKAVKVGDRWPVSPETARNLTDYDSITSNTLEAKLESLDDAGAQVRLGGEVRGSARGGEGTIKFAGRFTFDRKAKRISRLEVTRDEDRKEGPVEAGLTAKSTLKFERDATETPVTLSDDAIATLPRDDEPSRERLLLSPPEAKYTVEHDRDWHLKREDPRSVMLAKIDKGLPVAYLRLSVGPNAVKGRHQDTAEFAADVKKAVGDRFEQVASAEEIDAGPNAGFQYKVAILGHEGDRPVLWYYYLLAGPNGDQLLAIFTLDPGSEQAFSGGDRAILGTLEWKAAPDAK